MISSMSVHLLYSYPLLLLLLIMCLNKYYRYLLGYYSLIVTLLSNEWNELFPLNNFLFVNLL